MGILGTEQIDELVSMGRASMLLMLPDGLEKYRQRKGEDSSQNKWRIYNKKRSESCNRLSRNCLSLVTFFFFFWALQAQCTLIQNGSYLDPKL